MRRRLSNRLAQVIFAFVFIIACAAAIPLSHAERAVPRSAIGVAGPGLVTPVLCPPPRPLKIYRNKSLDDFVAIATAESQAALEGEGYEFVREEGYVPQCPGPDKTPFSLVRCGINDPANRQTVFRYDVTVDPPHVHRCDVIRVEGQLYVAPAITRTEVIQYRKRSTQSGSYGATRAAEALYASERYDQWALHGFMDRTEPVEGWRRQRMYWLPIYEDNLIAANLSVQSIAANLGYEFIREEGWVSDGPRPGTIPIYSYQRHSRWPTSRGVFDHFLGATPAAAADAVAGGYRTITIDGYCYANQLLGTVPLKRYWHQGRGDYFTLSTAASEAAAIQAGYQLKGTECFVYPEEPKGVPGAVFTPPPVVLYTPPTAPGQPGQSTPPDQPDQQGTGTPQSPQQPQQPAQPRITGYETVLGPSRQ